MFRPSVRTVMCPPWRHKQTYKSDRRVDSAEKVQNALELKQGY